MRKRLNKDERRAHILDCARALMSEKGFASTEMEDIRLACGISRGGLYHHFSNKRAILAALVMAEAKTLARALEEETGAPIPVLLAAGSSHLGGEPGILSALKSTEEKQDYLSAISDAHGMVLREVLEHRLVDHVRQGVDPAHVAELFLTVNAHINRREILGQWSNAEASGFAATALEALAPFLRSPGDLEPMIKDLKARSEHSCSR